MPSTLTLHLQRPRQWSKRELHLQNAYLQMQSGTILSICLPTGTVQTCLRNSSSGLLWIWQIIQPPGLRQTLPREKEERGRFQMRGRIIETRYLQYQHEVSHSPSPPQI